MKKYLIGALVLASSQVFAWGQYEQGLLLGAVVGTAIIAPRIYQQSPVYIQQNTPYPTQYAAPYGVQPRVLTCGVDINCSPAPLRCSVVPVYTGYGEFIGNQSVCK